MNINEARKITFTVTSGNMRREVVASDARSALHMALRQESDEAPTTFTLGSVCKVQRHGKRGDLYFETVQALVELDLMDKAHKEQT